MDTVIAEKFEKMGARVRVTSVGRVAGRFRDWRRRVEFTTQLSAPVRIDIRHDDRGEYFDLVCREDVNVSVLDLRPKDRHLLLMAREAGNSGRPDTASRFLCGHDERSWFVAAVPETARAGSVQSAKDALKPQEVWDAIRAAGVSMHDRDRRRTDAFIRQGEWFFIPRPQMKVNEKMVLRNEPIRRGAGKPHMCQFVYRTGGEAVWACSRYPNGLTQQQYRDLPERERQRYSWRPMVRNAQVYAKGNVRHPDHKTVWLGTWHLVVPNTETQARAMRHVAFLD